MGRRIKSWCTDQRAVCINGMSTKDDGLSDGNFLPKCEMENVGREREREREEQFITLAQRPWADYPDHLPCTTSILERGCYSWGCSSLSRTCHPLAVLVLPFTLHFENEALCLELVFTSR